MGLFKVGIRVGVFGVGVLLFIICLVFVWRGVFVFGWFGLRMDEWLLDDRLLEGFVEI